MFVYIPRENWMNTVMLVSYKRKTDDLLRLVWPPLIWSTNRRNK